MDIDKIIRNTLLHIGQYRVNNPEVKADPTALMIKVCDFLKAVYPEGHMVKSVAHVDVSLRVYNDYPNFLSMRHAWRKKKLNGVGLEYPAVRAIPDFLRDVELKRLLGKRVYESIQTIGNQLPVTGDELELYNRAIEAMGHVPQYYPAEFRWVTTDGLDERLLTVTIDMGKKCIAHVNSGIRDAHHHGGFITVTAFSMRHGVVDPSVYLPTFGDYSRYVGIDLAKTKIPKVLDDITNRIKRAQSRLYNRLGFISALTSKAPLAQQQENAFTLSCPPKDINELAEVGEVYQRWVESDPHVIYVGLVTKHLTSDNELAILWLALKYEEEQTIYICSDKCHPKAIQAIPIKVICGNKELLGYPINFKQWDLAMTVINQITQHSTRSIA